MPLKKPKNVPKIPKTRDKTIDSAMDSVPRKKESEIEYVCKVYFHYNLKQNQQEYCINIHTIKEFSTLNYELTVKSNKSKNNIDIVLSGLKTNQTYISEVKPAEAKLYFKDLYGKHTVNIIKQDGSINSAIFDFNVFKKEIKLVEEFLPEKENNRKFCSFKVENEKFTFSREGNK